MLCPTCHTPLHISRDCHGAIWLCTRCKGAAANLAVLRKRLKADLALNFWRKVLSEGTRSARPCPECQKPLTGFKMPVDDHAISLDLCKRCQIVWFDGGELEAMPKAPPPVGDIPAETKRQVVLLEVERSYQLEAQRDEESARTEEWADIAAQVLTLALSLISKV